MLQENGQRKLKKLKTITLKDNNENDEHLKVTSSHLFPVLVKAIQELSETNKKLTSRIEELEKK